MNKKCLNVLPLIEESLYSMCGTVIYLIIVPNVEESGELGVTSITAMEVISVGQIVPQ